MKSRFIKGTNNQYSIREDGFVIGHYYNSKLGIVYKNKIYKRWLINKDRNTYITKVTIKHKRTRLCITKLLREYFPEQFIHINQFRKIKQKEYKDNDRKYIGKCYISKLLGQTSFKHLPQEILEAKKQQLLLHRQCKTINL